MKKTISILILLILIPTLCFAGALQEKQRQVIAKKNTAGGGSPSVMDSYSESNCEDVQSALYSGGNVKIGQSFTGNGASITSAKFHIKKTGSPTGNATVSIYAHSGTYGTSSVATGSAVATSGNLDVSTLTTSFALVEFTFSSPYETTNATNYVVAIEYSGGDGDNAVNVCIDTSSSTHDGNFIYYTSSWDYLANRDTCFYVYGQ
jgi:hypothetical protein